MEIAIGLLAHNEERRIAKTLGSLFHQSIFGTECRQRLGVTGIEVICVPNGCTDQTAAQIGRFADELGQDGETSLKCCEIAEPGKSRAWNAFVHLFSTNTAKYLILVDADIEFGSDEVLERVLLYMEEHPHVVASTDRPVKLVASKSRLSLQDRLSIAASNQVVTDGRLSGQFYCGRADELRRIWMPVSLPVEDGFIAAMILTDGFSTAERSGLIAQVPGVFHYYDTHETIRQFIRHECRIVLGSTINAWLFGVLWERGKSGHVGEFIRRANEDDPNWLEQLVAARSKRFWLIPGDFVFKRLRALRGRKWRSKLTMLPLALGATFVQLFVCFRANSLLRNGTGTRFW
ncbi:glycosyltransferase family 2 protein [Bradyrhizobium manausense]|uniref:glycosyltransferase family 2 protein n=1 Tax=Bradyrhizobium manausense TaxID=989370 RepID=UPI001BAE1A4B|nr:glycosyltransferase [Bradyrhizobium manausense]MBR0725040.1 glycosyltransferase [Bradyrhizobium manausense]